MGRHDHILALLIEGEPARRLPRGAARDPPYRDRPRTAAARSGSRRSSRWRRTSAVAQESGRYLRRMAKLRVLACVLGVKFDDLRRREQERRAAPAGVPRGGAGGPAVRRRRPGGLRLPRARPRGRPAPHRRSATRRGPSNAPKPRRRRQAEAQRRRAEVELAEGTVLQGDLLGSARPVGRGAGRATPTPPTCSSQNNAPPLTADLGLWDASRHVDGPLLTLAGHTGGVFAVAVSPDGRQVLSGGADQTVRLWDLHTGQLLRTLTGHGGTVHAVAFLPGSRALSAGEDKTVRLWDLASGRDSAPTRTPRRSACWRRPRTGAGSSRATPSTPSRSGTWRGGRRRGPLDPRRQPAVLPRPLRGRPASPLRGVGRESPAVRPRRRQDPPHVHRPRHRPHRRRLPARR